MERFHHGFFLLFCSLIGSYYSGGESVHTAPTFAYLQGDTRIISSTRSM